MADEQDGWETVTDPNDVPSDIRKSLGVAGVRKALGVDSGGATSGSGKPAGVEQSKAASYLRRALGSARTYQRLGLGPRSLVGQQFADSHPGIANTVPEWMGGNSADRQVADASQLEFIAATLRQDSGAAIPPEEIETQRRIYFPLPGDTQAAINAKAEARKRAIEGLRDAAGGAVTDDLKRDYPNFFPNQQAKGGDQQSGAVGVAAGGSGAPPAGPGSTPPQGPDGPGGGTVAFNDELPAQAAIPLKLSQEQTNAMQALVQSGAPADAIISLGKSFGANITPENAAALEKFYADPKNRTVAPSVNVDNTVKPVDAGDGALGAGVRGAANAVTLGFMDELGAVGDTIGTGGTYSDNLDRRRGMELYDEQQHAPSRFIGQLVGGLPLGGVEFMGAREAASATARAAVRSGMAPAEARALATRVFSARTAAEAAGIGGVYGAGDAEGGIGDRLAGAGIGAATSGLIGGAAAYGGSRFARALAARRAARGPAALSDGQATLAAMDRQNVTPFAPDVGGPATRLATGASAQTLGGVGPIRRAAQATIDTAQAVRDRVAAAISPPAGVEETGEVARRGANRFIADTGARIGRIYERANQAAGRAVVETPEANRILAQELGPLEEAAVPSPGTAILQGLRDGLQTPTTVRGLRATRTAIRSAFENAGLRGSNEERIAGRVIDAATDDLVAGLRAQGLDSAARQYRVADRLWRERIATIDDHLTPILGESTGPRAKSGEQIVQALTAAMQGNNRRFAGFMSALPAEEQAIVRSSVISRLGQAAAGQQDQTGEIFSLASFLTQYNKIGARARQTLFGDEGRAALDDLALIANAAKGAQRYANFSNTGAAATTGVLTGAAAFGPLGILTAGKIIGLQYGAGRLLASPRFARWLARPPRQTTPAATQAYIERLSRIARSEPAIASDVLALQQRLADAFGTAPTRLAAQERNSSGAPVQGQQGQPAGPQQGFQP